MLQLNFDMKWVPVTTAAKMLGVSTQRVYALVKSGGLVGVHADGTVLIERGSVEGRKACRVKR